MKIKIFQQGGDLEGPAMAQEAPQQGGQDQAMQQLQQMAMEIIQSVGPDAAMTLAQMIVEILQSQQAPVGEGEPTFYKRGGKVCMKRCGGKSKKAKGKKC